MIENPHSERGLLDKLNEELTKAYVGGFLDGSGTLDIRVKKNSDYRFNFTLEPYLKFTKKRPHSIQLIDDWTASIGIYGSADKYDGRFIFRMNRGRDIAHFLDVVRPYVRDRAEAVDILADEVLPMIEDGYHRQSRETFIEVVELIDEMHEVSSKSSTSKYDADYFRELWEDELTDSE